MEKIKFLSLWKRQTKDGKTFLSGSYTYDTNITIWQNGFKTQENQPDFIAYLSPKPKKDEASAKPTLSLDNSKSAPKPTPKGPLAKEEQPPIPTDQPLFTEDDIPF